MLIPTLQILFNALLALIFWLNFAALLWLTILQRIPPGSAVPSVLAAVLFFVLAFLFTGPLIVSRKKEGKQI